MTNPLWPKVNRSHNTAELAATKDGKARLAETSDGNELFDDARRNLLKLGGGSVLGMGALALMNSQAKAQSNEPIPIGSMYPLTGAAATDGQGYKRGVELAIEEINDYGGILGRPLEPHYVDTKNMSASEVVAAANFLIDRHEVHAIINGYNIGPNDAEYEPIADAGIIYMHVNTAIQHHETVASDPDRYFGCFMADPAEYWYGGGYITMLADLRDAGVWTPPNNKIAIIVGSIPYSIVIADAMKEAAVEKGFEVAFSEVVQTPTTEWGPVLAKVRQVDPAAIANTHFFAGDIAQCQLQFVENPTNSLFYYQYGALQKDFRDIAGDASVGALTGSVDGLLPDDFAKPYVEAHAAKYGEDSDPQPGALSYGPMHHYAMAAAVAGGTGEPGNYDQNRKIAWALKRFTFRGPTGSYWYHPEFQATLPYPTYTRDPSLGHPHLHQQIQDKTKPPVVIYPEPYTDGNFILPPWFT
ncbi:ABC transporter substrate-binding protein [Roseobacter weihaiensis]|uniref:ABC transporter substrate-binding protein n=1 Tax=Roseobacter weihaiensis TaxID=2763262 RepID=UPI001D0B7C97|nr:ABC transporter substrate-binding protein [Roseobacter sp. H9]